MKARFKQYLLIAIVAAAGYGIMSYHFIFDGWDIYFLEKTSLHLHQTFYSIKRKKPETIIKNDVLREAGIADKLVEWDVISYDQKNKIEDKLRDQGYI
jgi:hypothetical protein